MTNGTSKSAAKNPPRHSGETHAREWNEEIAAQMIRDALRWRHFVSHYVQDPQGAWPYAFVSALTASQVNAAMDAWIEADIQLHVTAIGEMQ
jgi:hypothetical protein